MIGLVIVTHGRLAEEFIHAMEHVVGPQAAVSAICIGPDDDMERRRRDARVDQRPEPGRRVAERFGRQAAEEEVALRPARRRWARANRS